MSRPARVALVVAVFVVAVAAFVALRPGGDETDRSRGDRDAATATQDGVEGARTTTGDSRDAAGETATRAVPPAAETGPKVPLIRVRGGRPVGGVRELEVRQGATIRFAVVADVEEEVHLHAYDVARPVGPGRAARFSVPATIAGIFEVELEHSGVQIAKVTVAP